MELYMEFYIVRIYLQKTVDPLTLKNLAVFMDFELAKNYALQLSKTYQLKNKDNIDSNIFTFFLMLIIFLYHSSPITLIILRFRYCDICSLNV